MVEAFRVYGERVKLAERERCAKKASVAARQLSEPARAEVFRISNAIRDDE